MRLANLHLLSHLNRRKGVVFFAVDQLPDLCTAAERLTAVVYSAAPKKDELGSRSAAVLSIQQDWTAPGFWTDSLGRLLPERTADSAVFFAPLSAIPLAAKERLNQLGITELIYLYSGDWFKLSILKHQRLPAFFDAIEKIRLAQSKAVRIARLFIPKLILRFFGRDLRQLGAESFSRERGHCFVVPLPQFGCCGDRSGEDCSPLLLFEEQTMLLPHQQHETIRKIGSGVFAHWGPELYFSTTDNSDPNGNLRRYRIVDLSGRRRLLKPLLWLFPKADLTPKFPDEDEFWMASPAGHSAAWLPDISSFYGDKHVGVWGRAGSILRTAGRNFEKEIAKQVPQDPPRGIQLLSGPVEGIAMVIGSLAAGGSERQLSYLARGLAAYGASIRVLSKKIQDPAALHYLPLLQEAGIPHSFYDIPNLDFGIERLIRAGALSQLELMESIPADLFHEVWTAYSNFIVYRPRIVHCWLDHTNVIGGIAAYLAGVEKIILSTRSLNPTHFSHIHRDWLRPWYKILARSRRVGFIANSKAGALSYSNWLGIPLDRFKVIYNGLDQRIIDPASPEEIKQFRGQLGLAEDAQIIAGVLRLTSEKCPLLFVEAIAKLVRANPRVVGIHAGEGPMMPEFKEAISRLGLQNRIYLLGRRTDTPLIMSAADLLMLTSSEEGFPNVLMEAQSLGCPVVATRAGGAPEVVIDGSTGLIANRNDANDLAEKAGRILADPRLRSEMGQKARSWILDNFSVDKMIKETIGCYGFSAAAGSAASAGRDGSGVNGSELQLVANGGTIEAAE